MPDVRIKVRVLAGFVAALALSACVQPDGSGAFGASDSDQVFTFTMNGGGKGSSCSAQGAAGKVSGGTNSPGAACVTIRGNVRQGVISCQDASGGLYMTAVNQQVPKGLRNPKASASVWGAKRDAYPVNMEISGGTKTFYRAFVRQR